MFKATFVVKTTVVTTFVAYSVYSIALVTKFYGIYLGIFFVIVVSLASTLPLVSKK